MDFSTGIYLPKKTLENFAMWAMDLNPTFPSKLGYIIHIIQTYVTVQWSNPAPFIDLFLYYPYYPDNILSG